ncbi:hypothetical protein D3C85_1364450 [compost metagenome]
MRDLPRETFAVLGVERARRFLETGQVTGHACHETVGGLLALAPRILRLVVAAGLFNQLAQRDRGAAGLRAQPLPMAGQQGHLARHHAQLGPAAPARGGVRFLAGGGGGVRRRMPREDLRVVAAQVQIHLLARRILEGQDCVVATHGHGLLDGQRHVGQPAGGKDAVAFERGMRVGGKGGSHGVSLFLSG